MKEKTPNILPMQITVVWVIANLAILCISLKNIYPSDNTKMLLLKLRSGTFNIRERCIHSLVPRFSMNGKIKLIINLGKIYEISQTSFYKF